MYNVFQHKNIKYNMYNDISILQLIKINFNKYEKKN